MYMYTLSYTYSILDTQIIYLTNLFSLIHKVLIL